MGSFHLSGSDSMTIAFNFEKGCKDAPQGDLPAFKNAPARTFASTMRLLFFIFTFLNLVFAVLLLIAATYQQWARSETNWAIITVGLFALLNSLSGVVAVIVHKPSVSKFNFYLHALTFVISLVVYLVFIGVMWGYTCEFCKRSSAVLSTNNVGISPSATPQDCNDQTTLDNYDADQYNLAQVGDTVFTCFNIQQALTAIVICHLIWLLLLVVFALLYQGETVKNYSPLFSEDYLQSIQAQRPASKDLKRLQTPDSYSY